MQHWWTFTSLRKSFFVTKTSLPLVLTGVRGSFWSGTGQILEAVNGITTTGMWSTSLGSVGSGLGPFSCSNTSVVLSLLEGKICFKHPPRFSCFFQNSPLQNQPGHNQRGRRWGLTEVPGPLGVPTGWQGVMSLLGIRITGDWGQAVTSTSWAGARQHLPLLQGVQGDIQGWGGLQVLHIAWRELELPTCLTHSQVPVWVTALSPPIHQPRENHLPCHRGVTTLSPTIHPSQGDSSGTPVPSVGVTALCPPCHPWRDSPVPPPYPPWGGAARQPPPG